MVQAEEVVFRLVRFIAKAIRCVMRVLGPCLIVMAHALILSIVVFYFKFLLPAIVQPFTALYFVHSAFGLTMVFSALGHYNICIWTPPGRPDAELHAGYMKKPGGRCKHCKGPKPPRTHHCSLCNECVLSMDHHCPWVNNCIGKHNYRSFVGFLITLFVSCVYGVLVTAGPFFRGVQRSGMRAAARAHARPASAFTFENERQAIVLTFMLAASVAIAVGVLLAWHLYLISTGQTTIEFYANKERRDRYASRGMVWRNPYDKGLRRNWESVFGPGNPVLALLPSTRAPPAGPEMTEAQEEEIMLGLEYSYDDEHVV